MWFKETNIGDKKLSAIKKHYSMSKDKSFTESISHVFPEFDDSQICKYIFRYSKYIDNNTKK